MSQRSIWILLVGLGVSSIGVLIGPAVAGVFLHWGATAQAFWLDSASFLVSGLTLMLLPEFGVLTRKEVPSVAKNGLITDWKNAAEFFA